jgi:hypothetical protein
MGIFSPTSDADYKKRGVALCRNILNMIDVAKNPKYPAQEKKSAVANIGVPLQSLADVEFHIGSDESRKLVREANSLYNSLGRSKNPLSDLEVIAVKVSRIKVLTYGTYWDSI